MADAEAECISALFGLARAQERLAAANRELHRLEDIDAQRNRRVVEIGYQRALQEIDESPLRQGPASG